MINRNIQDVLGKIQAMKDAVRPPGPQPEFPYLDRTLRDHLEYQRTIRKYRAYRLRENYFLHGDGYDFSMFNV